jgi:hypothetical protein
MALEESIDKLTASIDKLIAQLQAGGAPAAGATAAKTTAAKGKAKPKFTADQVKAKFQELRADEKVGAPPLKELITSSGTPTSPPSSRRRTASTRPWKAWRRSRPRRPLRPQGRRPLGVVGEGAGPHTGPLSTFPCDPAPNNPPGCAGSHRTVEKIRRPRRGNRKTVDGVRVLHSEVVHLQEPRQDQTGE